MLHEDLELELKVSSDCHPSTLGRSEDDNDVNNQVIERLVIVTQGIQQNNRMSEVPSEESKAMSSELASTINDVLYLYEQELNSKQSLHWDSKTCNESRDENSRYPRSDVPLNSEASDCSAGEINCECPVNFISQWKQNEDCFKQLSMRKQRLFPRNFRSHGSDQISLGTISESPPSNSVGFYFGLPPDCNGLRDSKLSASPCKKLSGTSPPVGSVSKSFPPVQRPNYRLLEENHFKQQIYGLEKEFREDLYESFEQLTLDFYKKGNLYGLEKYREFHHFWKDRGQTEPLKKHPELERLLRDVLLRDEYCTLDDFPFAEDQNVVVRAADIIKSAEILQLQPREIPIFGTRVLTVYNTKAKVEDDLCT